MPEHWVPPKHVDDASFVNRIQVLAPSWLAWALPRAVLTKRLLDMGTMVRMGSYVHKAILLDSVFENSVTNFLSICRKASCMVLHLLLSKDILV